MKITSAIEKAGFGFGGDIGGLPRQTYYTPDGRVIKAFPDSREFVRRRNGEVLEQGTRDANLDRGWLLSPPSELKPFCKNCGRWHDTPKEVDICGEKQNKFIAQAERFARQEGIDKTSALEKQVAQLTTLVEKLTKEVQNRQVLQPGVDESIQVPQEVGGEKAEIHTGAT